MDHVKVAQLHLVGKDKLTMQNDNNSIPSHALGSGTTAMSSQINGQTSLDASNPVDLYRQHIAETLAPITGVPASEVSSKLQWTLTQDKGDLTLAVPALRIKGKKPNEQAKEWGEKVSNFLLPNDSSWLILSDP